MDRTSHSSSTGDLPLLPVKRERGNDDDLLKDSPKAKRLNPGSASAGNSRLDPIRMISNKTSSKSLKDNNPAGTSSSAGSPKPILSRDHDKSVHTSDTQLSRQQDALPGISPTRNAPVTQNDGSSLAAGTSATSSPNIQDTPTREDAQPQTQPSTNPESQSPDNILRHIRQADWALISHVDIIPCRDLTLKLHILDLKTRIIEREKATMPRDVAKRLDEMIGLTRHVIIRYVKRDGTRKDANKIDRCIDIDLVVKVLDLETRLVEWRRMLD